MSYDLQIEVDRIYRMIERKVLFLSTDPFLPCPLPGNCRLLKSYADNISRWATNYDHKALPSINGFHSWIRIIIRFGERVLNEAHDYGAFQAFSDPMLIRSSVVLLSALELLSRLRTDLTIKSKIVDDARMPLTNPYDCSTIEAISLQDQLIDEESQIEHLFQFLFNSDFDGKLVIEMKSHTGWFLTHFNLITNFWTSSFVDPLLKLTLKTQTLQEFVETVITSKIFITRSSPSPEAVVVKIPSCGFIVDVNNSDVFESNRITSSTGVQVFLSKTRSRSFLLMASRCSDDLNILDLTNSVNVVKINLKSHSKFQTNLQTLLDVYLWLWSPSGASMFGISPQHVTLMGRGLCGTLMVSLVCLLNKDRAANSAARLSTVHQPDRVVAICSPFLLKICQSPSRIFGFLKVPRKFCDRNNNWIGKTLDSLENYLDIKRKKKRQELNNLSHMLPVISYLEKCLSLSSNLFYSLLWPISDCRFPTTIEDWNQESDNWLRDVSSRINEVNKVASNGLVSPILHPRISNNHSTSLHLLIDHYNINLDDNVSLVKLWSGPLKLHILDDDYHDGSSWLKGKQESYFIDRKLSKILLSGE